MHQYNFVHIPRTGGSSLRKFLKLFPNSHLPNSHTTAWDMRIEDPKYWDSSISFCFVRNPWDHAVSWYVYHRGLCRNLNYNPYEDDFKSWVKKGLPHHWDEVLPEWKPPLDNDPLNLENYYMDKNQNVIVTYIAKFESLDAEIQNISNLIDCDPPNINTYPHFLGYLKDDEIKYIKNSYQTYYDSESRDIIGDKYKHFISEHNYSFDYKPHMQI